MGRQVSGLKIHMVCDRIWERKWSRRDGHFNSLWGFISGKGRGNIFAPLGKSIEIHNRAH